MDVKIKEKESATFLCKTSKPNLRGKWKKDGDEIAVSNRIDMKADGNEYSLTINDASPDDEGVYSFHVLNKRTSANLYVKGTSLFMYKTPFFSQSYH